MYNVFESVSNSRRHFQTHVDFLHPAYAHSAQHTLLNVHLAYKHFKFVFASAHNKHITESIMT